MVLKDFRCSDCDYEIELVVDSDESNVTHYCELCGDSKGFYSVCNGGAGSKSVDQWGYDDLSKLCRISPVSGERRGSNGTSQHTDKHGNSLVDKINSKKYEERRQRKVDEKRFKRQGPKIFVGA